MKLFILPNSLFMLCMLLMNSCLLQSEKTPKSNLYTSMIFPKSNGQYGYDIYKGDIRVIHQMLMPGVQVNNGFVNRSDAQRVADLMIFKLKNNIIPSSMTKIELDSMKITFYYKL